MTLRTLQSPFAIAQGHVFVRIIRALDDIAAAGHIELAIGGAIDFVRKIAAVVLFVALECTVDAFSIGAVEGACEAKGKSWSRKGKKNLADRHARINEG